MSMQRTLLPGLALALGAGCALGSFIAPSPWPTAAAGIALLLALRFRSFPLLWITFLFLGIVLGGRHPLPEATWRQLPLLREVRGTVSSPPERHGSTVSCILEVPHLGVKLLVYLPPEPRVSPGDTLGLRGRCELPRGGWGDHLRRRGIAGVFWADVVEIVDDGAWGIARGLHAAREGLCEAIERTWPEKASPLVMALLLGIRGELGPEVREGFRRAGVAHLLALSGLHLGIIAYGLWRALGLFRLRPDVRYLLLTGVVALYVLVAGARISLVRAGIMFGFLGLFWILWERGLVLRDWYDPLQGLSAAAMVTLFIWPWSALDLGFQLSFSATAGILLGWPLWRDSSRRHRLPRFLRPAGGLLWASLCAQAATMGFVGSAFGHISPYGFLANLLLIPWTSLIIWAGLLLLLLSPFGFSAVLGDIAGRYLVAPYLAAVELIADFPGAALPVGRHFGLWYAFAALVLVAFWSWRRGRNLV